MSETSLYNNLVKWLRKAVEEEDSFDLNPDLFDYDAMAKEALPRVEETLKNMKENEDEYCIEAHTSWIEMVPSLYGIAEWAYSNCRGERPDWDYYEHAGDVSVKFFRSLFEFSRR